MRDQVTKKWSEFHCDVVKSTGRFQGWIGTIRDIKTGNFEVDIGDYTTIRDYRTQPDTPLFKVISSLKVGQKVVVSGKMTGLDCNRDRGVWLSRDIDVQFFSVNPL